jgi:hypothetical protein
MMMLGALQGNVYRTTANCSKKSETFWVLQMEQISELFYLIVLGIIETIHPLEN